MTLKCKHEKLRKKLTNLRESNASLTLSPLYDQDAPVHVKNCR